MQSAGCLNRARSRMNLATDRRVMARFTLSPWLRVVGWITAGVMAVCVIGLFGTLIM